MKRFTISVICITVFFIGIASIIEKTKASFAQDAKAMVIINKARAAIGGETNIAKVKSMSIVAKTKNFYKDGDKAQQGELEINFALPNRYAKMIRIGAPGETKGDNVREEVSVIMMDKDSSEGEFKIERKDDDKNDVFIIENDGKEGDIDGVKVTKEKIIIKRKDGTTEEIDKDSDKAKKIIIEDSGEANTWTTDDGKKIIVKKRMGDGETWVADGDEKIIIKKGSGETNTWTTDDDKRIELISNIKVGSGGMRQNEMLRMTIALLLTPPEGLKVQYKFLGEGNVGGKKTNIVGIDLKEDSFKLHIDASSNLPSMLSFEGNAHRVMVFKEKGSEKKVEGNIIELKSKMKDGKKVAHEIKFSDFKTVGDLKLPYQWTETANGKMAQTVSVESYRINPADIEDKFKTNKIFVKKMKKN